MKVETPEIGGGNSRGAGGEQRQNWPPKRGRFGDLMGTGTMPEQFDILTDEATWCYKYSPVKLPSQRRSCGCV